MSPAGVVPVAVERYRRLMGAFPTGVAVLTAVDGAGRPHGLTCTSLTSVTTCPPTLAVSLAETSGTLAAIRHSRAFGLNLLRARARQVAQVFAGRMPDRFARVAWCASPSGHPWLRQDAFACADCVVVDSTLIGDHAVLFARIVQVEQAAGVPLLRGLRQFRAWPVEPTTLAVAQ